MVFFIIDVKCNSNIFILFVCKVLVIIFLEFVWWLDIINEIWNEMLDCKFFFI